MGRMACTEPQCLYKGALYLYMFLSRSNLHTAKRRKGKCIGHIVCRNCLLGHIIEGMTYGQEEEEEDISIYWIILRKGENTGN